MGGKGLDPILQAVHCIQSDAGGLVLGRCGGRSANLTSGHQAVARSSDCLVSSSCTGTG